MKSPAGLFLLLLALLLPLQGFAVAASCDAAPTAGVTQHCADHPDTPASGVHHHECGACCCLALATTPALILPGRTVFTARPSRAPLAAHPTLLLDRLDRPPRTPTP